MDAIERLLLKLGARDTVSEAEKEALSATVERVRTYEPGEIVVPEGVVQTNSQLLVSGVAARAKLLPDGQRQITEIHIDGDFVDLHSFGLKKLEHDVIALSPLSMAMVPHVRLMTVTENWPHLTRLLWLSTLIDAAIHREWIVSAGRRTAIEQVAHLCCEMMIRYRIVGLGQGDRCPLPLTQNQLADCCGLTVVHVNRVVQDLRAQGLVEWRQGTLAILDFERLAALAQFDPSYLVLDHIPR